MGFSFLTQALLRSSLPDEPWRHLIDSFGYGVGFIIVVLGRQQLFTESTLTAVLPVLARRDKVTAAATLRLWGIVLSANLIGTFAFAAMILPDGLLRPEVYPTLVELAMATMGSPFWVTMLKAIFAGWLIALMVWCCRAPVPRACSSSYSLPMWWGWATSRTSSPARWRPPTRFWADTPRSADT